MLCFVAQGFAQSSLTEFSSRVSPAFKPEGALDCSITASKEINISSAIDGILKEILVKPGDEVKAGQIIARVDTEIARQELELTKLRASSKVSIEIASERLRGAKELYENQRRGFKNNVVSRSDFARAELDYNLAKHELTREEEAVSHLTAELKRMEIMVSKGEITAPHAGIIGEEILGAGETVDAQPVAQLIVINPLKIQAFVPQEKLVEIQSGEKYFIGSEVPGRIVVEPVFEYISPIADSSSRTVRVYYSLEHTLIKPGFRCLLMNQEAATEYNEGSLKN